MKNGRVRPQLMESSVAEIIVAYNSEFRGFANYYAIADGVKASLDKLELVMLRSLFATVACRRRSTRRQAEEYLKMGSDHGVTTLVRGEPRVHKVWKLKHLIVQAWGNPVIDAITVGSRIAQSANDLVTRLSAEECEACGDTDGPFEMHHPHRLKDKRDDQLTPWVQSARRRRTIVLCRKCHVAHHGGRMPSGMESRVH